MRDGTYPLTIIKKVFINAEIAVDNPMTCFTIIMVSAPTLELDNNSLWRKNIPAIYLIDPSAVGELLWMQFNSDKRKDDEVKDPIRSQKTPGLTVLNPQDNFRFACHEGLDCFTRCCRDITIFLTPYDILRLKNGLGISSQKFLRNYTLSLSVPPVCRRLC